MLKIHQLAWRHLNGLPTQGSPRSFDGWQELRYLLFRIPLILVLGATIGIVIWQWKAHHYSSAIVKSSSPVVVSDMHYIFSQQSFPPKSILEPFQMKKISATDSTLDSQSNALPPDTKSFSDTSNDDLRMQVEQALREQHEGRSNVSTP